VYNKIFPSGLFVWFFPLILICSIFFSFFSRKLSPSISFFLFARFLRFSGLRLSPLHASFRKHFSQQKCPHYFCLTDCSAFVDVDPIVYTAVNKLVPRSLCEFSYGLVFFGEFSNFFFYLPIIKFNPPMPTQIYDQ